MARLILDSGGVIALAGKSLRAAAIIDRARQRGDDVVVPTVVIAETTRDAPEDANVNRVLKLVGRFSFPTEPIARLAGRQLRLSGVMDVNSELTIDALIVAEAIFHAPASILTGDYDDMAALLGQRPDVRILTV